MKIVSDAEGWRYVPAYLLNLLLCRFNIHGIGCRGVPGCYDADNQPRGRWHTRF